MSVLQGRTVVVIGGSAGIGPDTDRLERAAAEVGRQDVSALAVHLSSSGGRRHE